MSIEKRLTGYPSIDKPWLKYYNEETVKSPLPECTIYEYLWENNKDHLQDTALIYFDRKLSYIELFREIDIVAKSLIGIGVKENDVCAIVSLSCVNSVILFYALNRVGAISNFVNVLASQKEMKEYVEESASNYVFCLDLFLENVLASCSSGAEIISFSLSDYMPIQSKLAYKLKMSVAKVVTLKDTRVTPWRKFLRFRNAVNRLPKINRKTNSISIWAHTGGTT